ncbi:MAG: GTPase Era [Clostridia bacterium]|jgi:GTP-binding protein Era|nr:GTPase Era [Clostridia bacterium]
MEEFKSGFVTIVGRTNVGKSTLINSFVGEKIAATTNKPQTTRKAIRAIITRENSQIIFIDTPGIHKPKTKLGDTMLDTAFDSILQVDVVIFLIEATSEEIGKGDRQILEKIKQTNKKTILVINKIDLIKREKLLKLITLYKNEYNFSAIVPISALKNNKTEDVLQEVEKLLKPGPLYYEKEEYTDQTMRQLVEEIVREKALKFLEDEVPHGIYVEVEKMERKVTKDKKKIYNIEVTIYCLRNSHKGIIIGKNGQMLKKIGIYSRYDLEKMLDSKINLKTWVKVKQDWQDRDDIVKKFKFN